jgi:hypothetical protein
MKKVLAVFLLGVMVFLFVSYQVSHPENMMWEKLGYSPISYEGLQEKGEGDHVSVEGTIQEIWVEEQAVSFTIRDSQGQQWLFTVGKYPVYIDRIPQELENQKALFTGEYQGYDETLRIPQVSFRGAHKLRMVDRGYSTMDFGAEEFLWDEQERIQHLKQQAVPATVQQIQDGEFTNQLVVLEGIVADVLEYTGSRPRAVIYLIQKTDEGYQLSPSAVEAEYSVGKHVEEIRRWDAIALYAQVGPDNGIHCVAEEEIDLGGMERDIENEVKSRCRPYPYSEYAQDIDSYRSQGIQARVKIVQAPSRMGGASTKYLAKVFDESVGDYPYRDLAYIVLFRQDQRTEELFELGDELTVYGILSGEQEYFTGGGEWRDIPVLWVRLYEMEN